MKILKLLMCILTLSIGSVYAGCEADLTGVELEDKSQGTSINICTDSGKDLINGLKSLKPDIAKKVIASVSGCNCTIDQKEIKTNEDDKSTYCADSRSIELNTDGSLEVKVKSSVVAPE